MDFTFGIITAGNNDHLVEQIIESIEKQKIPNYEIIIVGSFSKRNYKVELVEFDETLKNGWITKKKNLITNMSKYENIVFLHDYIKLSDDWYLGQLKMGNDFKIRMDVILNLDGTRFRDWCIWPHNHNKMDEFIGRDCLIPYDITNLSKYMYISGSYWVAKKDVMKEVPLDENLTWGRGEDVEWSKRVRQKYDFQMNVNSSVHIMKPFKDKVFVEPNEEKIKILQNKDLWLN